MSKASHEESRDCSSVVESWVFFISKVAGSTLANSMFSFSVFSTFFLLFSKTDRFPGGLDERFPTRKIAISGQNWCLVITCSLGCVCLVMRSLRSPLLLQMALQNQLHRQHTGLLSFDRISIKQRQRHLVKSAHRKRRLLQMTQLI